MELIVSGPIAVVPYDVHHAGAQVWSQAVGLLEELLEFSFGPVNDFLVSEGAEGIDDAGADQRVGRVLIRPWLPAEPLELGADQRDHAQPVGGTFGPAAFEPIDVSQISQDSL